MVTTEGDPGDTIRGMSAVVLAPGIGIDDGPVAVQMPEMGMPDFGDSGMDMGMGMDMGGFDF
jgi:hypothetical protein